MSTPGDIYTVRRIVTTACRAQGVSPDTVLMRLFLQKLASDAYMVGYNHGLADAANGGFEDPPGVSEEATD